jgi:tight adherence protein C
MNSGFIIAVLTFVLVMLGGLLAFYYSNLYKAKIDIRKRIKKEVTPKSNEASPADNELGGFLLRMVRRFGESVKPQSEANISKTRIRLLRAGFNGENDSVAFFGSKAVMAILFLSIMVMLKFTALKVLPAPRFVALMIVSTVAGFYLPDYYLYKRTQSRKRKNFEGFPDALDLMVVCVEAGMGLDAAIKRVGDEMALKNKVLSDEFRLLSLELRAGKPRADALRSLAMRTDLEDVSSLVTLLIQTDRFGTRVAQALRVHSDSMRTKRYQRAEEVAAKLPIKILFPLVIFILPGLLITLLGPAVIKFYRIILKGTLEW